MHQVGDYVQFYDPNYRTTSSYPIVITYIHSDGKLELKDNLGQLYIDQDPNDWVLSWRPSNNSSPTSSEVPVKKKEKSKYCIYVDAFYLPSGAPIIPDNGKIPTSKIRNWVCINFREWPRCKINDKTLDLKYASQENHQYGKYVEGFFFCVECNVQRKKDERWKELLFV